MLVTNRRHFIHVAWLAAKHFLLSHAPINTDAFQTRSSCCKAAAWAAVVTLHCVHCHGQIMPHVHY